MTRLNGNVALYRSLLLDFKRDYMESGKEMRAAIMRRQDNDLESASRLAHSIKGIAGNLSATELQNAALQLETRIKQEQQDDLPLLMENFNATLERVFGSVASLVVAEKNDFLKEDASMLPQAMLSIDRAKVAPLLLELADYISDASFKTIQCFDAVKPLLKAPNVQQEVEQLQQYLYQTNFDEAQVSLAKIAEILEISIVK